MKETKLNPRQSPQKPPKPEMKSNQVIFGDRSNSEWKLSIKWHDIMIFQNIEYLYFFLPKYTLPNTVESPKKIFTMAISFS